MVWGTDRPAMTIAGDLGRKATKLTNLILSHNSQNKLFLERSIYPIEKGDYLRKLVRFPLEKCHFN